MMNRQIKGAVFDLDGTLIDSMGIWSQVDAEFLSKRSIAVPEDIFGDIETGNNFFEVANHFKKKFSLPDSVEEIVAEWTNMVAHHYATSVKLKPGVEELLELLKKNGIKIGIGTSNTQFLLEKVLKANRVLHFFDTIVTGCQDVKGKPFPDIFIKVAEELGVKPEECFVCEDVLAGVQAGKNAGMFVIAIEDKHSIKEKDNILQLTDYYADNYYNLINYFKEQGLFSSDK